MIKTHIVDNNKVFEYENTNIFIIEDFFNDTASDSLVKLIDKLPLTRCNIQKGNNVDCFQYNLTHYNFINTNHTYDEYYVFHLNKKNDKPVSNSINLTNKLNGVNKNYIYETADNIRSKFGCIHRIISKVMPFPDDLYDSGISLRKICGKTRLHIDGCSGNIGKDSCVIEINKKQERRILSIIISLNDNYDGGIFSFPNQNVSFKLKKNSVLFFPPYWTHPHKVSEVENSTSRYTINTWLCEK